MNPRLDELADLLWLHEMMSADLLAEFGQRNTSGCEDGTQSHGLDGVPPQQTKALIPGLSETSSVTAPVVKGDDQPLKGLWRKDTNGAEVLFEASDDEYGLHQEFGDFEGGPGKVNDLPCKMVYDSWKSEPPASSAVHSPGLLDLEGIIDPPQSLKSNESQYHEEDWGDLSTAISHEEPRRKDVDLPARASSHGQLPVAENAENEEWASFEDGEPTAVAQNTSSPPGVMSPANHQTIPQPHSQLRGLPLTDNATAVPAVDESSPTNLPPPVILLQILPKVFQYVADIGNTEQNAQAYNAIIQFHTVASRLIAGRTLRWKRDNILSQSAKIGPAAAGGKGGGMKLAAIDKSESLKEEREVADVIQAWARHAHFFNSTVHKSGIQRPLMTLSENLRSHSAKGAEILKSAHACALCGLKRDERIPGADFNINDSFGEFWIEHWGHRLCKDFWNRNQALLPRR